MSELVSIGEICGAFGVRGEVKVRPLTDFPERFRGMREVLVGRGDRVRRYAIDGVVERGGWWYFKLAGVETREQAQALRGARLQVTEAEVQPLPEDCYYVFQLRGLAVYDQQRGLLGTLSDVLHTGANDVYVVRGERYGEVLIPAIRDVVLEIDLAGGRVQVRLLPGLLPEEGADGAG